MLSKYYRAKAGEGIEFSGDLFNWQGEISGEFASWPQLPLDQQLLVSGAVSEGVRTYQHVPRIYAHPVSNRLVLMWHEHPYDEGGGGQWQMYSHSDDGGDTWSTPAEIFPPQDIMQRRDDMVNNNLTGRSINGSNLAPIGDKLYAVVNVFNRDYTIVDPESPGGAARKPIGQMAREVAADGSLVGDPVWIQIKDEYVNENGSVDPMPGYPEYQFDQALSTQIYNKVFYTVELFPRTDRSTGFPCVPNDVIGREEIYPWGTISEPNFIKPIGYKYTWGLWKNQGNIVDRDETKPLQGNGFKVYTTFTNWRDVKEFPNEKWKESSYPCNQNNSAMHTRFFQMDENTIFGFGNCRWGGRRMLHLSKAIRNPSTSQFDIVSSTNVREVDYSEPTQDYSGHGKGGGAQSPDIWVDNTYVYLTYSIKKEYIWFARIELSELNSI